MDKEEEIQLVKMSATDPLSFGKLYDHYYKKIFNYILRSTFDIHAAQDITAETFYKALKNISKFKITPTGTFQAWLYRIATNEVNQFYRKNNRYKFHPSEDMDLFYSQEVPEEEISNALKDMDLTDDIKDLHEEISKLDEKYRSIIFLKYFEGKKFSEIEEITGIKEGTLKSHLSRAIEKLRSEMQKKHPNMSPELINLIIIISLTAYYLLNSATILSVEN